MATQSTASDETRSVCSLSTADLAQRRNLILELVQRSREVLEFVDGYALEFPDDDEADDLLPRLIRLIGMERQCCPTFSFELSFAPEQGPIRLRVRGPEPAKRFIEALLSDEQAEPTTTAGGDES